MVFLANTFWGFSNTSNWALHLLFVYNQTTLEYWIQFTCCLRTFVVIRQWRFFLVGLHLTNFMEFLKVSAVDKVQREPNFTIFQHDCTRREMSLRNVRFSQKERIGKLINQLRVISQKARAKSSRSRLVRRCRFNNSRRTANTCNIS